MKIQWIEQKIDYDGSQLAPHWIFKNFDLQGSAMVGFLGRCDVLPEKMVDLVDWKTGKKIFSEAMLHLIAEFFDADLLRTILLQRLLCSLIQQEIVFRAKCTTLIRAGNDLYDGGAKLSVSIATLSPVSTLLHLGVNVSSKNTPVPTKGLADYGIEPVSLARSLLETFKHEFETLDVARSKVKWVV